MADDGAGQHAGSVSTLPYTGGEQRSHDRKETTGTILLGEKASKGPENAATQTHR